LALGPGTRLGPYEVLGLIGAGAMGEVYRARDPRLSREVAIKTLPDDFARDAERLRRFEQESRAAGALQHPNIVTVFDVGSAGAIHFVVQELLEGRTLRESMAAGPLPHRRVAELGAQIAAGLAAAHDKGIVHRDLKPENVFVCSDGRVKILDFGLARVLHPEGIPAAGDSLIGTLAETGMLLGTAGYMAPEQVRGEPADARADIFALGSILYEMLAGHRAFGGGTPFEALNAILNHEPEPMPPVVPVTLTRLVERCLEKDRARRFQSARDLGFALEAVRDGSEARRVPAAVAVTAAPAPRRGLDRRVVLPVVAALGFALGAFATHELAPPATTSTAHMRSLTYSEDLDPAASPDGRTIAFASTRDGTRRIWLKDVVSGGEVVRTAGLDQQPRFSPDGASILYTHLESGRSALYRVPVLGGEPRRVLMDASDGDWSPDGAEIAYISSVPGSPAQGTQTRLMVAKADGGGARQLASTDINLFGPRWSPDGRHVAVTQSGLQNSQFTIRVFETAPGGRERTVVPPGGGGVTSVPCWVDGGRALLFAEGEGLLSVARGGNSRLYILPMDGSRARRLIDLGFTAGTIDRLPDGRVVCSNALTRENLREMSLTANGLEGGRWLTRGPATDRQPTYSPDGRWVMFSSNSSGSLDLWEMSLESGEVRRLTDDPADDWDPAYSPDGNSIYWSSNRSGPLEIWSAARDGSAPRQVSHDSLDAENPYPTRDGWVIYASANPVKSGLWRVRPDGTGAERLAGGIVQIPEVSPDGQWVAYTKGTLVQDAAIRVVRAADGKEAAFSIGLPPVAATGLSFGRCRWVRDSRSIIYSGFDDRGVGGLYLQPFDPTVRTPSGRRVLSGSQDGLPESFGISPDGTHLVLGYMQNESGLMISDPIAELATKRSGSSRR